jgi:uncharacterized protein (TIGR02246 family)
MRSDKDQIRAVLSDYTRAFYDKNAANVVALLTEDVVAFELAPPLLMGPQASRNAAWYEEWFQTWDGPVVSESLDLQIAVGGDIAYAYTLQHLTGTRTSGEEIDLWFRATAGFRREDGQWRIAHLHNSVPFAMDGSEKALMHLKP